MSSKMAARIKLTEAKLQAYFCKMQKIYDSSLKIKNKTDEAEFIASACNVAKLREEFIREVEELNMLKLEENSEYEPNFQTWDAFESLYTHIQGKVNTISVCVKIENSPAPIEKSRSPQVKLPPIELPKFDGNRKSWPLFYECFNRTIHSNDQLSSYEKVYYLCGQLTGKAQDCIAGIAPTGDNYDLLYDTLVDKYQDVRSLGSIYLNEIINLKGLTTPSAEGLNSFMDKFAVSVSAFEKLDIKDKLDFVFLHLALQKLDRETVNLFENSVRGQKIPTYEYLQKFVKEQAKILELSSARREIPSANNKALHLSGRVPVPGGSKFTPGKSSKSFVAAAEEGQCPLCSMNSHKSYAQCSAFLKLAARERYNVVKRNHGCVLCLSARHTASVCKVRTNCESCSANTHNSMLHFVDRQSSTSLPVATDHGVVTHEEDEVAAGSEFYADVASVGDDEVGGIGAGVSLCSMQKSKTHGSLRGSVSSTVLLATARVRVVDSRGESHLVRCLIDNGSQNHFITAQCCKRLSLTPHASTSAVSVHGFGGGANPVRGVTELEFFSRFDDSVSYKISPLVVDRVTDKLPTASVDTSMLSYLTSVPLADNTFHIPGEIEMLIGAQLFAKLLLPGRVYGPPNTPDVMQTTLGFIMTGHAPALVPTARNHSVAFCAITERPMNDIVSKFWELEEVSPCVEPLLSPEEQECELFYQSTTTRDSTGRYSVALPFKSDPTVLGSSEKTAEKRFFSLERKFKTSPPLREAYDKVVNEYLENDYLTPVKCEDVGENNYIIPHHGVIRNDKVTTKLRVVLDASAQTDKGVSLNQILHSGPNLQGDIFRILLNFRLFSVAYCADVRQMYLQILVHPEYRKYLRIFYRFHPNEELQLFEFNRVCFGLSVSPFLALRTMKQLASDESEHYPLASNVVQRDLYMDDVVSSERSVACASETALQLINMFEAGGFDLLKWSSNSLDFLSQLPETHLHPHAVKFDDDICQKILGVKWEPRADQFSFDISPCEDKCTKRVILSTVARLWDVLGFAAPVILHAKLLIKDLWDLKIDWDECPPQPIIDKWTTFRNELAMLSGLNIPRHLGVIDNCGTTLLAFADASEKAYGAVIYLRVQTLENVTVRLVCAKSRVAPLKTVSLARLELCAALLLSKLVRNVLDTYKSRCDIDRVLAFSDSTVALHWIHSSPHRWKAFIANRISKIQENLDASHFYHVSGKENPADCLSRGLTPSQLVHHPLWFEGPSWTVKEMSQWPVEPFKATTPDLEIPEAKTISLPATELDKPLLYTLAQKISSWPKLLRVVTYILRFARKLKSRGSPSVKDLNEAELAIIRSLQTVYFADEIRNVQAGKSSRPVIQRLRPILVDGILRVGGRLERAELSFDHKHPILLPKKDHIVNLIVDQMHRNNCHTGPNLLLSLLRQRYWILSGRNLVRSRVHLCNFCFRTRPKTCIPPVMADLPKCRFQISKPFAHTGLDYCGPLNITLTRKRGIKSQKAYICVFICLTTRAVHVEVAPDLSTDAFLNALKRFLARRGTVEKLFSDNGTNFIGARSYLNELHSFLLSKSFTEHWNCELANQRIEWEMIPPNAPHFGGGWESTVKSFKTHLMRVIGTQILTYEELLTVLCQIEAVLNSRPLGRILSPDPSEPVALTPAHFLHTVPLKSLPSAPITQERDHLLSRYLLLDKLVQSYWRRWSTEYLHTLQEREKWLIDERPIMAGTVVLIMQNNTPPLHWPLGVVLETYPGADRKTRVVLLKTKTGTLTRPVVKLCPLPNQ